MATKYFCDRCGKPIDKSFGVGAVKFKVHSEVGDQEWDEYKSYDLCPDCASQIRWFIREA